MRHKILLSLLFASFAFIGYSQNKNVTGNVIDAATNQPLYGATIIIEGTNLGATSGSNGRFSISAPMSAKQITVSFLGYEPQTLDIVPNVTVSLVEMANVAEEIVVTGYSLQKKKDLTGSIGTITSDENFAVGKGSAQQALQGRIAGVNVTSADGSPGGGISIQIRGTNTLYGNTEPLYVVDGVPLSRGNITDDGSSSSLNSGNAVSSQNALAFLDPNDIASIEVLKDASSIALYGSRGVNGVILITTKSGAGTGGQDRININYNVSVSKISKKLHMLSSREYAEYANLVNVNTNIIKGKKNAVYPGGVQFNGMWDELEGKFREKPSDFSFDDNTYWQDQILRTAVSHDLSVDFSGSAKGMDYAISAGMLDQQGVIRNSSFKRYSIKASINKEIKPWLKVGTIVSLSNINSHMLKSATSDWNNGNEGVIKSALFFPPTYRKDDPRLLSDELNSAVTSPLSYVDALNQNKATNVYTSNYMNVTLAKGLIFRTVLGYTKYTALQNQYYDRKLWEGRQPTNGLAIAGDNTWESLVFENMLMYNHDFGKHNVSATLASSWEKTESYNKDFSVTGFGTDSNQGWILQEATTKHSVYSNSSESKLMSGVFRAAYNYDYKYFLTFNARYDASSKFASGNRGAFFPSMGVGYTVTREEFMQSVTGVLNHLKLRFSYGNTGNQGIGAYGTYALLTGANYPFGSGLVNGYAPDPWNPGNNKLKWETTTQADLGVDISLFNRLDITVDLYHKKTKDMLQHRELPGSSGLSRILDNIGTVVNKGIELTVNSTLVDNKDRNVRWDLGFNYSLNKNKITKLGGGDFFPNALWNSKRPFINAEGRPIGQLYGYVYDGIWQSREEVINSKQFQSQYAGYTVNDNVDATETVIKQKWIGEIRYKSLSDSGEITEADQVYLGTTNPKYTFGLTSTVTYRGFDLYLQLQGSYGNKILNQPSMRFYDLNGTRNVPVRILNKAWSPENPGGTAPKIWETYERDLKMSALFIEDGSYLKLRNVTLGYTFRSPWSGISNLRAYVTGTNLLTFTSYKGYDPEVNSFTSSPSIRGIDGGGYPHSRSIIFGVNITF